MVYKNRLSLSPLSVCDPPALRKERTARNKTGFKRCSEAAIITVLAIAGLIVGDGKSQLRRFSFEPPAARWWQTEEGVLDNVLRFVAGKPEANEIAKQGFAQFPVQGINSGVVRPCVVSGFLNIIRTERPCSLDRT